jgi:hypothetical protein
VIELVSKLVESQTRVPSFQLRTEPRCSSSASRRLRASSATRSRRGHPSSA